MSSTILSPSVTINFHNFNYQHQVLLLIMPHKTINQSIMQRLHSPDGSTFLRVMISRRVAILNVWRHIKSRTPYFKNNRIRFYPDPI